MSTEPGKGKKRCKECGKRIRAAHHAEGAHHNGTVKRCGKRRR